eukprot:scaffold128412_cov63-Phaeocystis_antarctica.AAC.2
MTENRPLLTTQPKVASAALSCAAWAWCRARAGVLSRAMVAHAAARTPSRTRSDLRRPSTSSMLAATKTTGTCIARLTRPAEELPPPLVLTDTRCCDSPK